MSLTLVYFSATGRTKRVAEAVAAQLDEHYDCIDLGDPSFKGRAVEGASLVVACPVYGGRIPSLVRDRLKQLQFSGARAVSIVTYGNRAYEDALLELNDGLREQGAVAVAGAAVVCSHSMLPSIAAGKPSATDMQNLSVFARFARESLSAQQVHEVVVPGNRPYRQWQKMPMTPVTVGTCVHCGECVRRCPVRAINPADPSQTDPSLCLLCMRCVHLCPQKAKALPAAAENAIREKLSAVAAKEKENQFFFALPV